MTLGAYLKKHDPALAKKSVIDYGKAGYFHSVTADIWAEFVEAKDLPPMHTKDFMFRCSQLGQMDVEIEVSRAFSGLGVTKAIGKDLAVHFAVGHAFHKMMQERTKKLLGVWVCKKCHKVFGMPDICLQPVECECKFSGYIEFPKERIWIGKFQYFEWFVWSTADHLQGHIDAPTISPDSHIIITDYKTCSKDMAKKIYYDGPNKKDIVQLISYMWLSGEHDGRLVYVNTNKTPNFMQEFVVKWDERVVGEVKVRIDYFRRCMDAGVVLSSSSLDLKPIEESSLLKEKLWFALTK